VPNEVTITVKGQDQSASAIKSVTNNVQGMQESFKKAGQVAAGINLADKFKDMSGAAKEFLSSTTQAASGLEQSMGSVDTVFKGSADQVHAWGAQAADSVGMSQRAFNEAASSIGGMLNNLGFSLDESTSKTGDLTKRAADMAATFGGDASQAIDAIGAALRGETDPIERYGVLLNQATVEAKAMAMTGKTTADSLTLQEKAAARLAIIMDQTADSQGQFARESDTVAGSQQRMTAAIEDGKAALGTLFAPAVKLAADVVTGLVHAFEDLPGPLKIVVGSLVVMVAAAVAVAPAVTAAATAMGALGISGATAGTALKSVGSFLIGPWGAAIGAGVAVLSLFAIGSSNAAKRQQEMRDAGKQVNDAIREQNGVINENVRKTAAKVLEEKGLLEQAQKIGVSGKDVVNAYLKQGDALTNLRDKLNDYIDAHSHMESGEGGAVQVMDKEGATASQLLAALDGLVGGRDADSAAAGRQNEAAAATTENTETSTKAFRDNADAIHEQTDALLASSDAHYGLLDSIDAANQAAKDNGKTLDENTEKGRNNQRALQDIVASTLQSTDAIHANADANRDGKISMDEAAASQAAVSAELDRGIAGFIEAAGAMGMSKDQARAYAVQLGLIPRNVFTKVELEAAAALSNLAAFQRALDNIPRNISTTVTVRGANITPGSGGHYILGQEHGGIAGAGSWWAAASGGQRHGSTLVNEAGPEVMELPSGAHVATAGATRALAEMGAFSGGGGTTNVNVSLVSGPGSDSGAGQWIASLVRRGILRLKVDDSGRVVAS
jgi:hypothetical protein